MDSYANYPTINMTLKHCKNNKESMLLLSNNGFH